MKTFQQFSEDIEQRRQELRQRQLQQMATYKKGVSDYQAKLKAQRNKEQEHQEIVKKVKRELQTEQTPTMQPNLYSQMIAKSQMSRKRAREAHAQREMEHEAQAQQSEKRARMRAILSR